MKMSSEQAQAAAYTKLTKADLKNVRWRWYFLGEASWNYEKMQGLGYCFSMMPVLRKLYPNQDDLREALRTHMQYFNTHQEFCELILGADCAMEEQDGAQVLPAVASLKAGLMGPLAGIGDTLYGVIANTIFFSIGSYLALEGNPIGVIAYFMWALVRTFIRGQFITLGYQQGTKIITTMSEKLGQLTAAASVLGITVVGALIASVVSANVSTVLTMGEVTMEVQAVLDQIMPKLIPVVLVALLYWLLGKKGMTSFKAILLVLALGIVLGGTGILS